MTLILPEAPVINAVNIVSLNGFVLPFTSHVLEGSDDSSYEPVLANSDDKYIVKSIDGLAPPDRNVAIASTAAGGVFGGVTSEDRELVALIALNPDWDAGETPKLLRDNLYTLINPGYDPKVEIDLMSGLHAAYYEYGYVSKFEAAIFDANPAVQITFTMLNETFRAVQPTVYNPADLSETAPDIYNYGTAETGFQFAVKFLANMNHWYINQAENQNIGMRFEADFEANDVLSVSTVPGQKYVQLKKHRKKVQNKLSILTDNSEFIQLHPGHNHFVTVPKADKWDWDSELIFTARSWGV